MSSNSLKNGSLGKLCLFVGAPGAGKGTQAQILSEKFGFVVLSTGDVLRDHIKRKTDLGIKVKSIMDQGNLVSDDVLLEIIQFALRENEGKDLILDGYPRNIDQVKDLDSCLKDRKLDYVLHFYVDNSELVERLSGRRVCGQCGATYHIVHKPTKVKGVCNACGADKVIQRKDDTPESIENRLQIYDETTQKILSFYEDKGVYHKIDAHGSIEDIHGKVKRVMDL